MLAKDGLTIIIGFFVAWVISALLFYLLPGPLTLGSMLVVGAIAIFNLFFFRDPDRNPPNNRLAVISPADGKVVQICNVSEMDYFKKEVRRISIFLSVFNVHVNRAPISGTVDYFAYHTGKFLVAFKEKASQENEQSVIGITSQQGHRVLFKQIAGLIARRIVCHLREGQTTSAGERMGLIRYGSRVDVFLPVHAKLMVQSGQLVRGGETVLAVFPDEGAQATAEERIVEVPKTEIST